MDSTDSHGYSGAALLLSSATALGLGVYLGCRIGWHAAQQETGGRSRRPKPSALWGAADGAAATTPGAPPAAC